MIRYIPVHHFSLWRSFQLKTLKIKMQVLNDDDQVINAVEHLIGILPGVTSNFAKFSRLADWVTIVNFVSEDDFQVDNTDAQLFLHIVKFTSVRDAHAMMFSSEVKCFGLLDILIFHWFMCICVIYISINSITR